MRRQKPLNRVPVSWGRISLGEGDRGFQVRGLGEVAIRCANLPAMVAFYSDVIGLEPIDGNSSDLIRFFKISQGVAGHTAVLALFHVDDVPDGDLTRSKTPPYTGRPSSLHHIALSLPFEEQSAAMDWFEVLELPYRVEEFAWVGWRGIFVSDPEGNTVELVAYDPASGVKAP